MPDKKSGFLSISLFGTSDSVVKNPPANAGDVALIPGLGRSPGEGNSNPLQCSCLRNSMDGEALAGYNPWGYKRIGCDLVTEQQQQSVLVYSHADALECTVYLPSLIFVAFRKMKFFNSKYLRLIKKHSPISIFCANFSKISNRIDAIS